MEHCVGEMRSAMTLVCKPSITVFQERMNARQLLGCLLVYVMPVLGSICRPFLSLSFVYLITFLCVSVNVVLILFSFFFLS